jgi:hypothetical protein
MGWCQGTDSANCTGFLKPFPCCRGAGVGNCGDIFQLGQYVLAQCDNHVLESSQTQTAELPVCVVTPKPDFDCYQADSTVSPPVAVTLADMFGSFGSVQVAKSQRMCTPAFKETKPAPLPLDPNAHLVGYELKGLPPRKVPHVHVASPQFGDFTVDVTRVAGRAALLVPSSKSTDPKHPPSFVPINTGHFLCYNFTNVTGSIPGSVLVRDQFNLSKPLAQTVSFQDLTHWRLCVPVNKNNLDPGAETSTDGLLCLVTGKEINPAIGVGGLFVSWSNQIQTAQPKVHLDKLDDFCVPATITK